MKNISILPADTYIVINKTILNEEDRKIITMLYQPIIGYTAVSLYFTLIDDLDKREMMSDEYTHHHLMSILQLKLDDIIVARRKIEAVGLLKTYFKKDHVNHYAYLLYSPLSPSDFFNHPILNVVLYNNVGKKEYDHLTTYFKLPRVNLKDFTDITSSFHEIFSPVSGNVIENEEMVSKNSQTIVMQNKIDFDLLVASIPKSIVHEKCFNEETRNLINSLAYVYDIDDLHMQGLVRNNINVRGMIDKTELRKACRSFYQFENNDKLPTLVYQLQPEYLKTPQGDTSKWAKMVYTFESMTPYDYLGSKYKTGEPTSRDLKLVESLMVDVGLKPGVVNAIIDYVLKVNDQKLSKPYLETLAGQLARLHVETVEDAMRVIEKEHKKLRKQLAKKEAPAKTGSFAKKKEEKLPEWFDKEIKSEEMDEASKQELDSMLQQFS